MNSENKNMILNPDKSKVDKIKQALIKTNGYCPCMLKRSEETKCPCRKMKEEDNCICGLYVKKK